MLFRSKEDGDRVIAMSLAEKEPGEGEETPSEGETPDVEAPAEE